MYSTELQLHNDEKLFLFSWFELYYNVINQISLGWLDSSIMEIFMKTICSLVPLIHPVWLMWSNSWAGFQTD